MDDNEIMILLGVLLIVIGPLLAWIGSWLLYGFGEIIDTLMAIERHTRQVPNITENTNKE